MLWTSSIGVFSEIWGLGNEVQYVHLGGNLLEPLRASPHSLGGHQAEDVEHGLNSMRPVVPECGLTCIGAPNRSQPLRVAVRGPRGSFQRGDDRMARE